MNVNNYSMFLLLKFLLYEVLITIKRVQKKYEDIIINDLISMKENVNINLWANIILFLCINELLKILDTFICAMFSK